MKTLLVYLAAVCWCCCWFLGCGGGTDVSIANANHQEQNQASDEAQIQTAQDACAYCADSYDKESSLSQCVTSMGFDVSDC